MNIPNLSVGETEPLSLLEIARHDAGQIDLYGQATLILANVMLGRDDQTTDYSDSVRLIDNELSFASVYMNPRMFIALSGLQNRVVGALLTADESPNHSVIHMFAVQEACRNLGVGSQLLTFTEKRLFLSGTRKISLDATDDAVKFYQRQGYKSPTFGFFDYGNPLKKRLNRRKMALTA